MPRPTKYTKALAEKICELIATTHIGLKVQCANNKALPSEKTIYNWLKELPEFLQQYTRARERQADLLAAEILAIADDSTHDNDIRYGLDGEPYVVEDKEWTGRSKLRVDARKWLAGKLAPKVYGDKLELGGNVQNTVNHVIILDDGTKIPI